MNINTHFGELQTSYLFGEVYARTATFQAAHPEAKVLRLGVGDVTRPLAPAITKALHHAVDEQAHAETFRGYGSEPGYAFLREAIVDGEYASLGVTIDADDVFVGEGSISDVAGFQELFSKQATVAVTDPVYPMYIDSNALVGRLGEYRDGRWQGLTYLECSAETGYKVALPDTPTDLIYLCSPNNPTGTALSREELEAWVRYAKQHGSVIVYDVAYRAFIQGEDVPRSIYEIEGADEVAVESGSFSKSAGFTGLRCSWLVVPKKLHVDGVSLRNMWDRRQATKFNGTPYIVQRAAEAVYSPEGREQVRADINYYLRNAELLRGALLDAGVETVGGEHSPYLWFRCPGEMGSWEFFDALLEGAQVVGTPGEGFGPAGAGYFRLSAFASYEEVLDACERFAAFLPQLTKRS
ncbi:MAG: LL-diaminopimelate aminotransferase [Leucobacter sp.]